MEISLFPIALACVVSLVLSIGAILWCALFSAPASIRKWVDHGIAIAKQAEMAAAATEMKFLQFKIETEGILEAVEGVLSSVEKKRRRVSGAESRLNAAMEPEPQTREQIVAAGRAKIAGLQ